METIDVIILTYNQASLLPRALESVKTQIVDCKVNIIVGNDCSSDDTLAVLEQYSKNITVFTNSINLGASGNLAKLLSHCKGDYIAILEGDDFWILENKLQQQVNFLRANTSYYSCGCDIKGKNPIWIKKSRKLSLKNFNGQDLCYHTSTTFMRNPKLKSYEFLQKGHRSISDRILHGFLLSYGDSKRLNFEGVAYEPNNLDNLTKTIYLDKPNCYLSDLKILIKTYETIKNTGARPSRFRFFQTKLILFGKIMLYFLRSKNKKITREVFAKMTALMGARKFVWIFLSPICIISAVFKKIYTYTHYGKEHK